MYLKYCISYLLFCVIVINIQAARILVYFPTAAVSHQIVTRDLALTLVKRGHEVVQITSDPMFPKGKTPPNFTEIDVHDEAYAAKKLGFAATVTGKNNDILDQVIECFRIFSKLFEAEIKTKQVQALLNETKQKFDLLILEGGTKPVLILSHVFKAPVILYSSFGAMDMFTDTVGSAMHPLLFPTVIHQKTNSLTMWDKIHELYKHYAFEFALKKMEKDDDEMLKRHFGPDIPPLNELKKRIDMVFLAEHHLWDNNRPVPPNMIYLGGIYPNNSTKEIPKDIKTYLDSSQRGVVYTSFGTSVMPSLLPPERIEVIVKVLSKLPYDVLLKWDTDHLPGLSKNVRIFKWLPQSDVLRHPKIKLFITQGGLQSSDDAIAAAVPLIGMPMLGDQWYNVEQYVRLKIGLRVDIESLTEENFMAAINTVINDESYRRNMASLRQVLADQPQTALDRAVWWVEYVIRNKGAKQLKAPSALISYWDFYEIRLSLVILFWLTLAFIVLVYSLNIFLRGCNLIRKEKKD